MRPLCQEQSDRFYAFEVFKKVFATEEKEKARALSLEAFQALVCYLRASVTPERLGKPKHTRLFGLFLCDEEKGFITL